MFPAQDPIGATFTNGRGRRFTVVGVVSDVKKSLDRNAREAPPAYVVPGEAVRAMTSWRACGQVCAATVCSPI